MSLFIYLFWPNPGNAHYGDLNMIVLLAVGFLLAIASLGLRAWRAGMSDHRFKKISASWQSAAMSFGLTLLFLVVCRVESIQFLAMRVLIFLWIFSFIAYVLWQLKRFKTQYFQIVPRDKQHNAIDKYLPKKRR